MTTDVRTPSVSLTPDEAEAVFELWAKKQAETEALRSRLTLEDMAEAMSTSPSEVQGLLAAVRASRAEALLKTPAKKVKPVNTFLISVVSGVWVAILAGACWAAYQSGYTARASLSTPLPPSFGPNAPALVRSTLPDNISKGIRVSFDGYVVSGESVAPVDADTMFIALEGILAQVGAAPSAATGTNRPAISIINALQANDPKLADNLMRFEKMVVSNEFTAAEQLIPIPLTSDERICRLVREEQEKRLKKLASQAREQAAGYYPVKR